MVASKLKRLIRSVAPEKDKAAKKGNAALVLPPEATKKLEKKIGYAFKDRALLTQSLTHPSFLLNTKDQLKNNQRLEFLGDSVIQLVLTEKLYRKFPRQREGKLTSVRSGYARGEYMAEIARAIELGTFLILKEKDRDAGVAENDSALADAFEALIGAIYLDSNFEATRKIVMDLYNHLDEAPTRTGLIANPKGKLQEKIQPLHGNNALRYETTKQTGEAHDRTFEVTVFCFEDQLGVGVGKTKKEASEKAALQALQSFQDSE